MPTREEKRQIRAGLFYFESALRNREVTLENREEYLEKLTNLLNLMLKSRISDQSSFCTSFREIQSQLEFSVFTPGRINPNLILKMSPNPRAYFGFSYSTPLTLNVGKKREQSLLLMRVYKSPTGNDSIRLSWEFNPFGKITSLGYCTRDKQSGEILRIVTPFDDDWKKEKFDYEAMPPEIDFVNSGFSGLNLIAQYTSLLRFGQQMASELFENLRTNKVKGLRENKRGFWSLEKIIQDPFAMQILGQSKREFSLSRDEVGKMNVEYQN
jgi:hypothetical protein